MKRSERYTVPEKLYSVPDRSVYREAFRDLPLIQRIFLTIQKWFSHVDIAGVIKQHELDEISRRIVGADMAILEPSAPALREGFYARVRAVRDHLSGLKLVFMEIRGTGAGPFLVEMLQRLDADLYAMIDASCTIPEELMTNPATTAAEAKTAVRRYLMQSLEANAEAIREHVSPIWDSIDALAFLATVDYTSLAPGDAKNNQQIPLRAVKESLLPFTYGVDLCIRNRKPAAIREATEFVSRRIGRRFKMHETVWDAIDAVHAAIPLADLTRLAFDEPRLELAELTTSTRWWKRFVTAWLERLDVEAPLLRHRTIVVENLARNAFGVTETTVTWIPPSLFQRAIGVIRRLGSAQLFRDTRTMVGALAREQNLMPAGDRAGILEAHVELDAAYSTLEELTGIGESRGTIGEELRRIQRSDSPDSITGVHKMNVYSRHRPEIRGTIDRVVESFQTISGLFRRNRAQLRRALKTGGVRVDLGSESHSAVEVLELITDTYQQLAVALQGLAALEEELTATPATETSESDAGDNDDGGDDRHDGTESENDGPADHRGGGAVEGEEGR